MSWKCLSATSIGIAHKQSGKPCEDVVSYSVFHFQNDETLICLMSDGAGSAKYAKDAANLVTVEGNNFLQDLLRREIQITSAKIFELAEYLYSKLENEAQIRSVNVNEFSCTFLGCVIFPNNGIFFQVGDGLIVRTDEYNNYSLMLIPQNGEYSNTTNFLIDDANFGNLKITELDFAVHELAITTDGLQNLILKNGSNEIHQPFFANLFKWLRLAKQDNEIEILNQKLNEYLASDLINSKTDDDKTLFLATRLNI